MSISSKALLVNVSIRQWLGKRLDKRATETVELNHLTNKKVGQYTKKLIPESEALREIQRLSQAIRVFFYQQTLPWCSDGSRIISSKNYMYFTSKFRSLKQDFEQAVKEFLWQYPKLKEQARMQLGNLFQEFEYPSIEALELAFSCEITFLPVPDVTDFRVELTEQEKNAFLESMRTVEKQAIEECWSRLKSTVSKAADRLADPKAVFRDSLIENIQDICQLMPKLNVTEDPDLEAMRIDVERLVSTISASSCREHNQVRNEAAKKLADITDKMSAFYSG